MCGIFAFVGKNNNKAKKIVFEGLKKLEYRGYDSWGIAVKFFGRRKINLEKHIGKIGKTKIKDLKARIAIGHTRWATHGGVTDYNAHPHLDCFKRIAVVHNGIVENYQELKDFLVKKNHFFVSETDTEVIAHLIEENLKNNNIKEAVFSSFQQLVGLNAILVLDGKEEKIVACRNGSPLVLGLSINGYFLASDVTALLKHTNKVYYLMDGEGVVIDKEQVKVYDVKNKKRKNFSVVNVDWHEEEVEKKGFKHYLIKEIFEQKSVLKLTIDFNRKRFKKLKQYFFKSKDKKIIIIGCGSAYHCGLLGKYFFARSGVDVAVYPANEIMEFVQFFDKKTIVLAISQSGETADTLQAVKEGKKRDADIIALVNARGSTLERLANFILPVMAGPEIAVVSTKAFINQSLILYYLSKVIVNKTIEAEKNFIDFYSSLNTWLSKNLTKAIISMSKTLLEKKHIFVIGKGHNYPAALEFALKIKETSYLHAEAFAAGELKHGVIALVEKGTPCFVLFSNDCYQKEVLSNAIEVKARGGKIYGVGPFFNQEFDYFLPTINCQDLTVISNIIVGQLLGYYLGIGRGADPDKPRNLAKSVTVK